MAALVCSIQVASNWLGRPLKKTTLGIEHIYIIAKILFRAKQIQNRKGFRTCAWRAAPCAASRKINGRRCAPPTKWLVKNPKVKSWSIFTISLEPTLSKIPEKIHSPRRPPPRTAAYLAEKFSLHFLFCARPIFSSKRKRKFFCFGFRAQSVWRRGFALARGQKFPPPNPLHFCPFV